MDRTIKSKHARQNWAQLLRDAEQGHTTIIEHYNRPVAKLAPYEDAALDQALHRAIQRGRYLAEQVATCPLNEVGERHSTLNEVERTIATMVTYLCPWANAPTHRAAVRVATREHYLPELSLGLSATWRESADRWEQALTAVGVDRDRVRVLGGLTHAEAVAACAVVGIDPPVEPVSLEQRRREADAAWREAMIARGEDPDDW